MPELPEVELVGKGLAKLAAGRRILRAELLRQRLAPDSSPAAFDSSLAGAVIRSITRRGKHILFDLDNGNCLIVHLRMSGRFLLLNGDHGDPKFTHAVIHFDDGERLVFSDQRHFGLMKVVRAEEVAAAREIAKLAPEPFSDEFSLAYFRDSLRASRRSLKEFLLDQTKVCGLGNIYAAEAMFVAGIHPGKYAHRLSKPAAERLWTAIRAILHEAIAIGSTLNTELAVGSDIGYYGGRYEDHWRVYGREGLPCPRCDRAISRIVQAGRSSYFCRTCQRR